MTDVLEINGIKCVVKSSARKTLSISVERDGSVIVAAPREVTADAITKYVRSKRLWIHQKLSLKSQRNKEKVQREFVNGQGFLYLGKSYRLKLLKDGNNDTAVPKSKLPGQLHFHRGYFELPETELSRAREHFIDWYKKRTEELLKTRIPRYAERVGAEVKIFRVLDLKNRWASYGTKGTLNFNWRSVMAPIWVFDYILVHELAHMIQKGHTKEFWQIVGRVMPEYQEYAAWLQEHGAEMNV